MTYILAFLAAVAGAVAGFFLATALGSVVASAFGISSFEGASGYFAVFLFGLPGGLIGLVLGLWLVFRYKGGHRTFSAIACAVSSLVAGSAMAQGAAPVLDVSRPITLKFVDPGGIDPPGGTEGRGD